MAPVDARHAGRSRRWRGGRPRWDRVLLGLLGAATLILVALALAR